jgi:predicted DNA-binding protein (MmcQ/YjbR family)
LNIETYRAYCIAKKGVTEDFPFDHSTLVFKVLGKMFALADVDAFESVNLKCRPEEGVALMEQYVGINPGYHMNKKHWITVDISADVGDQLLIKLIDDSYDLVVAGLPKKQQQALLEA